MATLRNKRKLAVINRENHEEIYVSNQLRITVVTGTQDKFITHVSEVSEEIEGRVANECLRSSVGQEAVFWALYPS